MKQLQVILGIGALLVSAVNTSTARAAEYWAQWISEESGNTPSQCVNWNEGAVGFGCSGQYCDDVRLRCETMPSDIVIDSKTDTWSRYFSEETDGIGGTNFVGWYPYVGQNFQICNPNGANGIMSGIRCKGSYCDDISIECGEAVKYIDGKRHTVSVKDCSWTGWISEEQGSVDFGNNRYVGGVECSGKYCDNKRFLVCSLDPTHLDPSFGNL